MLNYTFFVQTQFIFHYKRLEKIVLGLSSIVLGFDDFHMFWFIIFWVVFPILCKHCQRVSVLQTLIYLFCHKFQMMMLQWMIHMNGKKRSFLHLWRNNKNMIYMVFFMGEIFFIFIIIFYNSCNVYITIWRLKWKN